MHRSVLISFTAFMALTVWHCGSAMGDEPIASTWTAAANADSSADNPLADVAAERAASPTAADKATAVPIVVTFRFGDRDPSLTCNVIDTRPVTAETTVGRVLAKTAKATHFRGAEASISVLRPRSVIDDDLNVSTVIETLNVEWDPSTNRPTEETNYKLKPGDRIVVKQPEPTRAVVANPIAARSPARAVQSVLPAPQFNPPALAIAPPMAQVAVAPVAFDKPLRPGEVAFAQGPEFSAPAPAPPIGPGASPQQYLCRFAIIADPQGNMEQFSPLQHGSQMIGDSESVLGALRILEKNQLIKRFGDPSIVCSTGRPASFHVGAFDEQNGRLVDGTEIDITPQPFESGMHWRLRVRWADNGHVREIETAPRFAAGQTLVARIDPPGRSGNAVHGDATSHGPVYIVMTPEPIARDELGPSSVELPAARGRTIVRAQFETSKSTETEWEAAAPAPPVHDAGKGQVDIPAATIPRSIQGAPSNGAAAPATVKFDVAIFDDTSGSMAEFIPPSAPVPCLLTDAQTIQAALRILEKQNLIRRVSSPKLMARAGESASLAVGRERLESPQGTSFDGVTVEALGRQLGGALAVEFKLHQNENDRKLDMAWAMIVPAGQSVLMSGNWRGANASASGDVVATDEPDADEAKMPVYVIVTPELVR